MFPSLDAKLKRFEELEKQLQDPEVLADTDRMIAVKMDVEGHEGEVLNGAEKLFTRNGGYAQIEALSDDIATALVSRMTEFGWRFRDRYGLDMRFEKP